MVTARAKQIVRVSLTILFAVQGPGTPFFEIAFAPTRVVSILTNDNLLVGAILTVEDPV